MSYHVKQSALADASIAAQVDWYQADESRGGEVLAKRWFEQLHAALAGLAAEPSRHRLAPENGEWLPRYRIRQMRFRPWKSGVGWRVLYTIDEAAKTVIVLQVRHAHRRFLHESAEEDAG